MPERRKSTRETTRVPISKYQPRQQYAPEATESTELDSVRVGVNDVVFWHGGGDTSRQYPLRQGQYDTGGFGGAEAGVGGIDLGQIGTDPTKAVIALAYMQNRMLERAIQAPSVAGTSRPGFTDTRGASPQRQPAPGRTNWAGSGPSSRPEQDDNPNRMRRKMSRRTWGAIGATTLLLVGGGGAKYLGVGPFADEGLQTQAVAAAELAERDAPGEIAPLENYRVAVIPDGDMTITSEFQLDPTPDDDTEYPIAFTPPQNELTTTSVTPEVEFFVDVPVTDGEDTAVRETTPEDQQGGRRTVEINLGRITVRAVSSTESIRDTPPLPLFGLNSADMSKAFGDTVLLRDQAALRTAYEERILDIPNIATGLGIREAVNSPEFLRIVQQEVVEAMGIDNPDEVAVTYAADSTLPTDTVAEQYWESVGTNMQFASWVDDTSVGGNSAPVIELKNIIPASEQR